VSEILFASEVAFRRLDGCMAQQELNLLQLTTIRVAQLGTGPAQVMRRNTLQPRFLAAGLDHIPDHVLRDAFAPDPACPGNCPEDPSLRDASLCGPEIERGFNPRWNRDGADMPAFPDQVHNCPVGLSHLDIVDLQADQLRSAQAATEQHSQHGVIALGTNAVSSNMPENLRALLGGQPIPRAKPELLHAFHATDSGGQFRTQQPRVGGFMSQTTYCGEVLVDRVRGQAPRFQVHAVTDDHDAVEGQTWLRAVPGNELLDRVLIHSARSW
jgi:hypothetical protein